MTEPNDFSGVERRITEAFRSHADSVQPSPDAYARLARAVNAKDAGVLERWGFGSYFRPVAFVAAVLVAFGLGGYMLSSQGMQAVESANGAPAAVDPTDVLEDPDAGSSSAEAQADDESQSGVSGSLGVRPIGPEGDNRGAEALRQTPSTVASGERVESETERYMEGLAYSPVGKTRLDAAEKFLELLGVTDVDVIETGGAANSDSDSDADDVSSSFLVRTRAGEGGDSVIITTLSIAPIGEGFVVDEARSDEYNFEFVGAVEGELTEEDDIFDPINIIAATDVELTDDDTRPRTVTLVPVIPPSPRFVAEDSRVVDHDTVGASRVWVVVGAEGPLVGRSPFSAKPAYFVGSDDRSEYTVFGLAPDDDDGGLVLRAEPNGEPIGLIRLGATGVKRLTIAPRLAGDRVWWAVTAPDGAQGWVASEYLAPNDAFDDAALVALGSDLRDALSGQLLIPRVTTFAYPVYVGPITDPQQVKRGLEMPMAWSVVRGLGQQTDGSDDSGDSMVRYFGIDRWTDGEIVVPDGYLDPAARRSANAYFGGLPSIAIETVNPDTGGRERVHIFVSHRGGHDSGLAHTAIVGIVLEREPINKGVGGRGEPNPNGPVVTTPRPKPPDRTTVKPEPD